MITHHSHLSVGVRELETVGDMAWYALGTARRVLGGRDCRCDAREALTMLEVLKGLDVF